MGKYRDALTECKGRGDWGARGSMVEIRLSGERKRSEGQVDGLVRTAP